ncbi:non-specific lipid transfer protein GPI-anchored 13-like [Hibiscus syriacus]|uniref:non-specific lipid transfer protein GPI-anchored 13-like n=1 Tax=Hibiscus syriacus TaxID=106335 RepID=UPI001921A1C5|nr:non-specific lipid transfer protein GPI-anchored 13-like [Hibiscus syriacus]
MLNNNELGLNLRILLVATLAVIVISGASITADSGEDKDKEECTQQLVGLATCLPYVGGTAKAPTPDCCGGLKQVLKNNKKCLCVIIKYRNDPDLGLNLNVTLALTLPSVCNAPANVSKCPELLHMDPNSPEAQIFYQLSKNSTSNGGDGSPAAAPGGSVEGPASSSSSSSEEGKSPEIQKGDGLWRFDPSNSGGEVQSVQGRLLAGGFL